MSKSESKQNLALLSQVAEWNRYGIRRKHTTLVPYIRKSRYTGSNPVLTTNKKIKVMKKIQMLFRGLWCKYCGRLCDNVGSGANMGTIDRPMCERCYENGGDC